MQPAVRTLLIPRGATLAGQGKTATGQVAIDAAGLTLSESVAVKKTAGSFGSWVLIYFPPKLFAMVGVPKVRKLVDEHVIEHPERHPGETIGDPDRSIVRTAGAPPPVLIGNPADRVGLRQRVLAGQCVGSGVEVDGFTRLFALKSAGHLVDPLLFLRHGHPGGDRNMQDAVDEAGTDGLFSLGASGNPHLHWGGISGREATLACVAQVVERVVGFLVVAEQVVKGQCRLFRLGLTHLPPPGDRLGRREPQIPPTRRTSGR